jgi:hypothetical protein
MLLWCKYRLEKAYIECFSSISGATPSWATWWGILIFGSDFWDPHRKQNSDSASDSGYSGRKLFLEFHY